MAKKNGLGQNVEKKLELIDTLSDALNAFAQCSLKDALLTSKVSDEPLLKAIDEACKSAFSLKTDILNLKSKIKSTKPGTVNSRFNTKAANKIVRNFIERRDS